MAYSEVLSALVQIFIGGPSVAPFDFKQKAPALLRYLGLPISHFRIPYYATTELVKYSIKPHSYYYLECLHFSRTNLVLQLGFVELFNYILNILQVKTLLRDVNHLTAWGPLTAQPIATPLLNSMP